MDFSQKQNTEALQARFPEVYQKFFVENDLVVSSSMAFSLNPALTLLSGGISIYQKLPFKVYIGFRENKTRSSEIMLGTVQVYQPHKDAFEDASEELNYWEEEFEYLRRYIQKVRGIADVRGCTISILCERQESIGFETSRGTMLMAVVMLRFEIMDIKSFCSMAHFSIQNNKEQKAISERFNMFHRETMKLLQYVARARGVTGVTVFQSILESSTPIIYFVEERAGSEDQPYLNLFPLDISKNSNKLDDMNWWGFRLAELTDAKEEFPLDVVSILSGRRGTSHFDMLEQEFSIIRMRLMALQKFVASTLVSDTNPSEDHLPQFLKELDRTDAYWYSYARGKNVVSAELLRVLMALYHDESTRDTVRSFTKTVNAADAMNYFFMDPPSQRVREIVRKLQHVADASAVEIGTWTQAGGAQDRSIFMFMEKGKMREQIVDTVEMLRREVDPLIHINFASWRDGWGKDGLRVEQFISKGIYSKFIEPEAVRLIQWTRKGAVRTSIVKHAGVKDAGRDLLIDMVHEKIQVAGKECTSKELPSQKATVAILDALLSTEGHRLHNRALPESGYTKYRNEFQGKITGPLVALVKKRLKRELPLKVEGTLTDFWVSIDPKGFEIGVVKKLG